MKVLIVSYYYKMRFELISVGTGTEESEKHTSSKKGTISII